MKDSLDVREMRTLIGDEKSEWRRATSCAPQGQTLVAILFLVYVNDVPEGLCSYINIR